jgi:hypothetical protein
VAQIRFSAVVGDAEWWRRVEKASTSNKMLLGKSGINRCFQYLMVWLDLEQKGIIRSPDLSLGSAACGKHVLHRLIEGCAQIYFIVRAPLNL